jgi:chemotaxis signal transduction protein
VSAHDPDTLFDGLECLIGKARVAMPMEMVKQVIEYQLAPPPPLAQKWVGGLGLFENQALVSIALVPRRGELPPRHTAKGVLLKSVGRGRLGWVLEVSSVLSFVRARILPRREEDSPAKLPAWILRAATEDDRLTGWIDVVAMLHSLAASSLEVD